MNRLVERFRDGRIQASEFVELRHWLESDPDVAVGMWFKRLGKFTLAGEGEFAKTVLEPGMAVKGMEVTLRGVCRAVIATRITGRRFPHRARFFIMVRSYDGPTPAQSQGGGLDSDGRDRGGGMRGDGGVGCLDGEDVSVAGWDRGGGGTRGACEVACGDDRIPVSGVRDRVHDFGVGRLAEPAYAHHQIRQVPGVWAAGVDGSAGESQAGFAMRDALETERRKGMKQRSKQAKVVLAALGVACGTELLMLVLLHRISMSLTRGSPWLEVTQLPGARIADLLIGSLVMTIWHGMVLIFVIQSLLYASVLLAAMPVGGLAVDWVRGWRERSQD